MKNFIKMLLNWPKVLKRRAICKACPQYTKNNIARLGKFGRFHSCGKFMHPVEGVSCGCDIELKTLLSKRLVSCPQNKW